MRDQPWLKLLDLVSDKLGAEDARVEIGGKPPEDPRLLWAPLDDGRRIVVVYGKAPEERAALRDKLLTLLDSFRQTLAIPTEPPARSSSSQHRELDRVLATLAERTGAETVWIIDAQSPVLWGHSEPPEEELDYATLASYAEADALIESVGLTWAELLPVPAAESYAHLQRVSLSGAPLRTVQDALLDLRRLSEQGGLALAGRRLRAARSLVAIRERVTRERDLMSTELRGPRIQCFAHAIAGQYQLVLVFDETWSPLHAAGNVQRALPYVEHLLLSLPPVDPSAGAAARAKVIRLPRRG